jgi:hypothetical protein
MPTIELTRAELKEVKSCLIVELENCQEQVQRHPPGCYDEESRKSYAKAVRLLESAIAKFKEAQSCR